MRRILRWSAVLVLVVPAPVAAQSLSFFAGASPPITIESRVTTPGLDVSERRTREETGFGFAMGLGLGYPITDRFEIQLEGARHATGLITINRDGYLDAAIFKSRDAIIWEARLALGYRLPTALPVVVSAGPAFLHFDPPDEVADFARPHDTWALAAGAGLDVPFSRHASFQVNLSDVVVLWDDDARETRFENDYESGSGESIAADIDTETTHILTLRTGFSLRL